VFAAMRYFEILRGWLSDRDRELGIGGIGGEDLGVSGEMREY
jgi:hypothetical protein